MRLSAFITSNRDAILLAWDDFARTIEPAAAGMDEHALRDHAASMLGVIVNDLQTPQTAREQADKSQGLAADDGQESYAERHATARLAAGYSIAQLVSEYRSLRAIVLQLWIGQSKERLATDPDDVTRFNEAIDQALAESVGRFSQIVRERDEAERSRLDAILAAAPVVQVRMEAALRESEAKFKTIANAMPQMVWPTLPNGFHDYFNQQWYEFTGIAEGASDGETDWSTMFHPDDREQAWKNWNHSLATGDVYDIQYRLRHRSGGYRWTLGRALPVRGESGEIIRWMGTCTDIHDQKLAEELLKEESQRKDEFLAMLAHELRNPLAPISTAAHFMKIASADEKKVRAAADIIARQVKHMTNLVDDLLDVSRITRGLVKLDTELLDLKLVVTSAIEQARSLIELRGHVIRLSLSSSPTFVKGDKTRLVQVIANLLNNAAKYTPQGGQIDLSLDVDEAQQTAFIKVVDNGSGISSALLPYVFDLFTQGERTPDRMQGGLGLGLSLVKNITALHGGVATACSEGPGRGSEFMISLPLAAQQDWPVDSQPSFDAGTALVSPLRLMVVDDNVDAAQSLAGLLEAVGHQVSVAEDGMSALAMPGLAEVQVFILDIGLPGMDGFELARRLCSDPATSGAVLIALTGYGQAHDRVLTKAAGFDHHFVKPIDNEALAKVLASVGWSERRRDDRSND